MSGYHGYSMSNNAVTAYATGEKPFSKWTKKAMLSEIAEQIDEGIYPESVLDDVKQMDTAQLKEFLRHSSWHHTSKFYNRTHFYSLDVDAIVEHLGYRNVIKGTFNGRTVYGNWTGERNESGRFTQMLTEDGELIPSKEVTDIDITYIK